MEKMRDEPRKQREKLLKELDGMEEFRRGSTNVFYRRCGKPRCVCNQEGHPGHGPQRTLTLKENGKTLARNLPTPAAVRVVSEQIDNHNQFKEWGKKWLKLNEEMADYRLGEVLSCGEDDELDRRGKKTAQAVIEEIKKEIEGLIGRAFRDSKGEGFFDLEAPEGATKDAMLRCGAIMLKHVLKVEDDGALDRSCSCGGNFVNRKQAEKKVRTVVGEVPVERTYQWCNGCNNWRVPQDVVLDVEGTVFSPGLRRMMAGTGADVCFDKAHDIIKNVGGLEVTDKSEAGWWKPDVKV